MSSSRYTSHWFRIFLRTLWYGHHTYISDEDLIHVNRTYICRSLCTNPCAVVSGTKVWPTHCFQCHISNVSVLDVRLPCRDYRDTGYSFLKYHLFLSDGIFTTFAKSLKSYAASGIENLKLAKNFHTAWL